MSHGISLFSGDKGDGDILSGHAAKTVLGRAGDFPGTGNRETSGKFTAAGVQDGDLFGMSFPEKHRAEIHGGGGSQVRGLFGDGDGDLRGGGYGAILGLCGESEGIGADTLPVIMGVGDRGSFFIDDADFTEFSVKRLAADEKAKL